MGMVARLALEGGLELELDLSLEWELGLERGWELEGERSGKVELRQGGEGGWGGGKWEGTDRRRGRGGSQT